MTDVKIVELIVQLVHAQKAGDRDQAAAIRRRLVEARILIPTPDRQQLEAAFDLWQKAA